MEEMTNEHLSGRGNLGELEVDEKILLKLIENKLYLRFYTGFNFLTTDFSDQIFKNRNKFSSTIKYEEILLGESLLAFQGLYMLYKYMNLKILHEGKLRKLNNTHSCQSHSDVLYHKTKYDIDNLSSENVKHIFKM
jgi:hypothetical protein